LHRARRAPCCRSPSSMSPPPNAELVRAQERGRRHRSATACQQGLRGSRGRICAEVQPEEGLGAGDRRQRGAYPARSTRCARNAPRTACSRLAEVGAQPAHSGADCGPPPVECRKGGPLCVPERSKLPPLPSAQSSCYVRAGGVWENCLGQAGASESTKARGRNVALEFVLDLAGIGALAPEYLTGTLTTMSLERAA
jgi:hypothetical protein